MKLRIDLDTILTKRKRSLYWLADETGIRYQSLWLMKKGKRDGIRLSTLAAICEALECRPKDIIVIVDEANQEEIQE